MDILNASSEKLHSDLRSYCTDHAIASESLDFSHSNKSGLDCFNKAFQARGIPRFRHPETTAGKVGLQISATTWFPPNSSMISSSVFMMNED